MGVSLFTLADATSSIDWVALSVFIIFFALVTVLGFIAARWRRGDLNQIHEWGLAGRRFGTIVAWFLIGGDLYTAYTFIAVPGSLYGKGAIGFFAVPYTIIAWPLFFIVLPKFWLVAKNRGYITGSDFVRDRFGSRTLALLVAITGIVATMPYIALQMVGIEVSVQQMGFNAEVALVIAFLILAAYTYYSGLRAPAMIAVVKDAMIYITVIVALIVIPIHLGGFGNIFKAVPAAKLTLSPKLYLAYSTLALGSALALFLYPHALTGVLSTKSRDVLKRNSALLPIYSLLLGVIALLGYMALAVPIHLGKGQTSNNAVPLLLSNIFPSWFAGFAFAAISIGALVPAAVMSIAAANLFTRNIYKEYFRKQCSDKEEANVAKTASLVVKLGALAFIIFLPTATATAINLQLLGGAWIIQTLPAVFLGLYTKWLHRYALVLGWVGGMVAATWLAIANNYAAVTPVNLLGSSYVMMPALAGLIVNLVLCIVLTPLFQVAKLPQGQDATTPADFEVEAVPAGVQPAAGD
ncbi:MAG TPA: sodium:solute symporter [Ktedonobacterales bacterium]|nr:sodium:solute symporter [Ktedonobacterales bacterium]